MLSQIESNGCSFNDQRTWGGGICGGWCFILFASVVHREEGRFVVTSVLFYLQVWCIEKKGSMFLALFFPLSFIITTFISFFPLEEVVSLRSVLGELLMVGSLYGILWRKKREQHMRNNIGDELLAVQAV
ncbi:hypothetical protein Taro_025722 [Colocasia esculenta]|uniref:WAT1-related protein n=1 Tax=Colocasia esculenta TaxID=4460 RepID=A0A843VP59_COLES|nr:hypothetical protein [Colocasia esculenta]